MKRLFNRYIAPSLERSWLKGSMLTWVFAPLLWPLSKVVWWTWRALHAYTPKKSPTPLAVPVLIVGNVFVGGVGKTPLVIALVEHCKRLGLEVGVVSRGYTPYNASSKTISTRLIQSKDKADEVGDEPLLIHQRTGALVCVGAHRLESAMHLLKVKPDLGLIISDDGLQSSHLRPDMTVCVFDDRGLGNGMTLPAGPLREPWPRIQGLHTSQLAPYQWVMNTGNSPQIPGFNAQRRFAPELQNARGDRMSWAELLRIPSQPILALAGIARPEQFFQMLRAQGLKGAQYIAMPDHADVRDYKRVVSLSRAKWAHQGPSELLLICTQKDAVKLWALEPQAWAVSLELEMPEAFTKAFEEALEALQRFKRSKTECSTTQNADIIAP